MPGAASTHTAGFSTRCVVGPKHLQFGSNNSGSAAESSQRLRGNRLDVPDSCEVSRRLGKPAAPCDNAGHARTRIDPG